MESDTGSVLYIAQPLRVVFSQASEKADVGKNCYMVPDFWSHF